MNATRFSKAVLGWIALAALVVGASDLAWADRIRGGEGTSRVRPVQEEPEHPLALQKMDDCDAMRAYFTEVVVESLVQARYGNYRGYFNNPWSLPGAEDTTYDTPGDFTGTNNQEAGVDELDIVKTDGNFIYVAHEGELIIVRSWPAASSEIVSRVELSERSVDGLFLFGDRAAVFSGTWSYGFDCLGCWGGGTRVDIVDLTDRNAPEIARTFDIEGYLVGARMIDGHVYMVLSSNMEIPSEAWDLIWNDEIGLPEVNWEDPPEVWQAAAEQARGILKPLVEALVAELELTEILPVFSDSWPIEQAGEEKPLLGCGDVYRTAEVSPYSMLSVVHLNLGGEWPADWHLDGSGILSDGWTVYASTYNLYVAQSSWWWWWWGPEESDGMTTAIHKFALGASAEEPVQYAATGEVDGWLHNQFCMSEYDGYLRVATTLFDWWWGTTEDEEDEGSVVSVLEDTGQGGLEEIGRVDGIAPGEQIFAARFMGEKGYLVTFEQVDPLFTIDLSEPTEPQVVGELEMPGFSAYLHPMDDDHLLAVGRAGNEEGQVWGLAVNVFDVSQFDQPQLVHQHVFDEGNWSWSEALGNHHAFTFHRGVLSIPAYTHSGAESQPYSGLIAFSIDLDDGISELGRVDHADLPGWSYPNMRRSIYIEDNLFSLSSRGLKINHLYDPRITIGQVPFYQPTP